MPHTPNMPKLWWHYHNFDSKKIPKTTDTGDEDDDDYDNND